MNLKDDKCEFEDEAEDLDCKNRPLLTEEDTTASATSKSVIMSQSHVANVPSYSSFFTEFYPPDLTKFKGEGLKYRPDNAQPACMTSAWRVLSFFGVVFVLPTLLISVPLYARYHIYHARSLAFTDGDMTSLHRDVSTFWCQGQRLVSNGTFDAYLTKEAKRRKRRSRTTRLSSEILLTHDDIEEWGVHLIKGSTFTFSACSRWAGAILLVVKGEENMRRCFYREERVIELLNEMGEAHQKKTQQPPMHVVVPPEKEDHMGGGEVFDDDENGSVLDEQEIIHKVYSPGGGRRTSSQTNRPPVNHDLNAFRPTERNPKIDLNALREEPMSKNEFSKVSKKIKDMPGEKKELLKEKLAKELAGETVGEKSAAPKVKRDVTSSSRFNTTNLQRLKVNRGSFFFNVNDTLDIQTGNSSFSSSEEFLRQCSNTVTSIDLSPYINCSQRASNPGTDMSWKFRVNETDNYYFIFTSDNSLEANVLSFRILLERRLYDVTRNLSQCLNASECVFPFSFMKSEGVIVDFSEHYENISKLENLHNYQMTTICQPRSAVYTVFILLVPFIIVLFAFR